MSCNGDEESNNTDNNEEEKKNKNVDKNQTTEDSQDKKEASIERKKQGVKNYMHSTLAEYGFKNKGATHVASGRQVSNLEVRTKLRNTFTRFLKQRLDKLENAKPQEDAKEDAEARRNLNNEANGSTSFGSTSFAARTDVQNSADLNEITPPNSVESTPSRVECYSVGKVPSENFLHFTPDSPTSDVQIIDVNDSVTNSNSIIILKESNDTVKENKNRGNETSTISNNIICISAKINEISSDFNNIDSEITNNHVLMKSGKTGRSDNELSTEIGEPCTEISASRTAVIEQCAVVSEHSVTNSQSMTNEPTTIGSNATRKDNRSHIDLSTGNNEHYSTAGTNETGRISIDVDHDDVSIDDDDPVSASLNTSVGSPKSSNLTNMEIQLDDDDSEADLDLCQDILINLDEESMEEAEFVAATCLSPLCSSEGMQQDIGIGSFNVDYEEIYYNALESSNSPDDFCFPSICLNEAEIAVVAVSKDTADKTQSPINSQVIETNTVTVEERVEDGSDQNQIRKRPRRTCSPQVFSANSPQKKRKKVISAGLGKENPYIALISDQESSMTVENMPQNQVSAAIVVPSSSEENVVPETRCENTQKINSNVEISPNIGLVQLGIEISESPSLNVADAVATNERVFSETPQSILEQHYALASKNISELCNNLSELNEQAQNLPVDDVVEVESSESQSAVLPDTISSSAGNDSLPSDGHMSTSVLGHNSVVSVRGSEVNPELEMIIEPHETQVPKPSSEQLKHITNNEREERNVEIEPTGTAGKSLYTTIVEEKRAAAQFYRENPHLNESANAPPIVNIFDPLNQWITQNIADADCIENNYPVLSIPEPETATPLFVGEAISSETTTFPFAVGTASTFALETISSETESSAVALETISSQIASPPLAVETISLETESSAGAQETISSKIATSPFAVGTASIFAVETITSETESSAVALETISSETESSAVSPETISSETESSAVSPETISSEIASPPLAVETISLETESSVAAQETISSETVTSFAALQIVSSGARQESSQIEEGTTSRSASDTGSNCSGVASDTPNTDTAEEAVQREDSFETEHSQSSNGDEQDDERPCISIRKDIFSDPEESESPQTFQICGGSVGLSRNIRDDCLPVSSPVSNDPYTLSSVVANSVTPSTSAAVPSVGVLPTPLEQPSLTTPNTQADVNSTDQRQNLNHERNNPNSIEFVDQSTLPTISAAYNHICKDVQKLGTLLHTASRRTEAPTVAETYSLLDTIRSQAFRLANVVDTRMIHLQIAHPSFRLPSTTELSHEDVDNLSIEEIAEYLEILIETMVLTKRPEAARVRDVAFFMIIRLQRLLHYFLCVKDPSNSERMFLNVIQSVMRKPIMSGQHNGHSILVHLWDRIRRQPQGMTVDGVLHDHRAEGIPGFRLRISKIKNSLISALAQPTMVTNSNNSVQQANGTNSPRSQLNNTGTSYLLQQLEQQNAVISQQHQRQPLNPQNMEQLKQHLQQRNQQQHCTINNQNITQGQQQHQFPRQDMAQIQQYQIGSQNMAPVQHLISQNMAQVQQQQQQTYQNVHQVQQHPRTNPSMAQLQPQQQLNQRNFLQLRRNVTCQPEIIQQQSQHSMASQFPHNQEQGYETSQYHRQQTTAQQLGSNPVQQVQLQMGSSLPGNMIDDVVCLGTYTQSRPIGPPQPQLSMTVQQQQSPGQNQDINSVVTDPVPRIMIHYEGELVGQTRYNEPSLNETIGPAYPYHNLQTQAVNGRTGIIDASNLTLSQLLSSNSMGLGSSNSTLTEQSTVEAGNYSVQQSQLDYRVNRTQTPPVSAPGSTFTPLIDGNRSDRGRARIIRRPSQTETSSRQRGTQAQTVLTSQAMITGVECRHNATNRVSGPVRVIPAGLANFNVNGQRRSSIPQENQLMSTTHTATSLSLPGVVPRISSVTSLAGSLETRLASAPAWSNQDRALTLQEMVDVSNTVYFPDDNGQCVRSGRPAALQTIEPLHNTSSITSGYRPDQVMSSVQATSLSNDSASGFYNQ